MFTCTYICCRDSGQFASTRPAIAGPICSVLGQMKVSMRHRLNYVSPEFVIHALFYSLLTLKPLWTHSAGYLRTYRSNISQLSVSRITGCTLLTTITSLGESRYMHVHMVLQVVLGGFFIWFLTQKSARRCGTIRGRAT